MFCVTFLQFFISATAVGGAVETNKENGDAALDSSDSDPESASRPRRKRRRITPIPVAFVCPKKRVPCAPKRFADE